MITSYFFGSSIRMPPICTNSAVTPAPFMPLTFSTKAGGNVFSIPKRMPIFLFAIIQASCDLIPDKCSYRWRAGRPPSWTGETPVPTLEILLRHPLPERPIVLAVVAVNIQPVWNSLRIQHCRHLHIRVQAHVPIRRSQHNLHLPVPAQKPVIAHVRQIVGRVVEVDIIVVIAVEETPNIERSAHGYASRNQVGMPQGKIQRLIAAKTAPRHRDLRGPVFPFQMPHELVQHVALVLHMPPDSRSRMHVLVYQLSPSTLSTQKTWTVHASSFPASVRIIPASSYS